MSVKIVKVEGKRLLRRFVEFPNELYKDSPYYVPELFGDAVNTLRKDRNAAFEFCEADYFLAYRDGKVVGRIAVILNNAENETDRFYQKSHFLRTKEMKHHKAMAFYDCLKFVNEAVFTVLVIGISTYLAGENIISVGTVLTSYLCFTQLTTPLRELHRIFDMPYILCKRDFPNFKPISKEKFKELYYNDTEVAYITTDGSNFTLYDENDTVLATGATFSISNNVDGTSLVLNENNKFYHNNNPVASNYNDGNYVTTDNTIEGNCIAITDEVAEGDYNIPTSDALFNYLEGWSPEYTGSWSVNNWVINWVES